MSEKPVVLKIENIKKRYMIKRFEALPKTKSEAVKRGLRNFFKPNACKEPFYALNGVSFNVQQGEKIGIIGKNGAGKSTLLKVISRITEPSDGRIEMLGKISSMLEVGTGFNMELTGRENVYLNGAILGMTKAEVDEKFDSIVEFSEVGKFIDTPVKRYSSGMFVRLAFAVAANLESDILLVDEVLAVGDTKFQQKCINKMLEIAASGRTILFVSHQMNTIRQLCDRVVVLKEGEVIYDGDVEEGIKLYSSDSYAEIKNHYEFDGIPRPKYLTANKAVLKSLDIVNNNECIYGAFDPIEFNIHFETKVKNLGDVSLRILFWKDDETAVSTGFSKSFASIQKAGEYDAKVILNNHHLSPGMYKATLDLTGTDSSKYEETYDEVYPAFFFEVLREDGSHRRWPRNWGTSRFDGININMI